MSLINQCAWSSRWGNKHRHDWLLIAKSVVDTLVFYIDSPVVMMEKNTFALPQKAQHSDIKLNEINIAWCSTITQQTGPSRSDMHTKYYLPTNLLGKNSMMVKRPATIIPGIGTS